MDPGFGDESAITGDITVGDLSSARSSERIDSTALASTRASTKYQKSGRVVLPVKVAKFLNASLVAVQSSMTRTLAAGADVS